MTIDSHDILIEEGDQIGAFYNDECRGVLDLQENPH